MSIFYIIIFAIPTLNLLWWWWADRRVAKLEGRRRWRISLAAFVLLHLGGYFWVILARRGGLPISPPTPLLAAAYIWGMIVLPLAMLTTVAYATLEGGLDIARWFNRRKRTASAPAATMSRRRALTSMAMVGAPVLTQACSLARGLGQLGELRTREFVAIIPGLPNDLEGLTIAHVSDTHVGRFTRGAVLDNIAARVNAMNPDIIAMTGDLIDYSLDDLPEAIRFARLLRPRLAMAMCEGNHDLFEGVEAFRRGVLDAGLPLLIDESLTVPVGTNAVQLLGIAWGARRGAESADHVARVAALRQPGAVPILLAHHPHAFDAARDARIPLTLAGHTHGGQLMLTGELGAGPMIFKYWSGLYKNNAASLIVSNGAGNWFPLRINAPAEVTKITLRAG